MCTIQWMFKASQLSTIQLHNRESVCLCVIYYIFFLRWIRKEILSHTRSSEVTFGSESSHNKTFFFFPQNDNKTVVLLFRLGSPSYRWVLYDASQGSIIAIRTHGSRVEYNTIYVQFSHYRHNQWLIRGCLVIIREKYHHI